MLTPSFIISYTLALSTYTITSLKHNLSKTYNSNFIIHINKDQIHYHFISHIKPSKTYSKYIPIISKNKVTTATKKVDHNTEEQLKVRFIQYKKLII